MEYLILAVLVIVAFQNYKLRELILDMATQAELEQAVQDVKDAFTAAVGSITDATNAAADRVIASLKANVDPSTQVAELEAFKQTVADAGAAEVAKLNAVDAPPAA